MLLILTLYFSWEWREEWLEEGVDRVIIPCLEPGISRFLAPDPESHGGRVTESYRFVTMRISIIKKISGKLCTKCVTLSSAYIRLWFKEFVHVADLKKKSQPVHYSLHSIHFSTRCQYCCCTGILSQHGKFQLKYFQFKIFSS